MSLEGEVALVTGATRGIGKAITLALGAEGAQVIGTATSGNGVENINKYLKDNDINGSGLVLDVTSQESVEALMTNIKETTGQAPSILVNNAGITRDNLLMRMKEEEWDTIMETNLKSLFRLSKACCRPMTKARKGRIVSISSVVGEVGNAGQTNYCAAKAGVNGFTRALARELAPRNITVNSVAPGFIDTDMTRSLPEEQRAAICDNIPLSRLGSAEDVAAAVVYLVSDSGAYITGTTMHVNGGLYMG